MWIASFPGQRRRALLVGAATVLLHGAAPGLRRYRVNLPPPAEIAPGVTRRRRLSIT
jgi:hypothetical protein